MTTEQSRVPTGVEGLDEVLNGGFIPNRTYMVRGEPGAGKSILGLQFLRAGIDAGENTLYVNLEEPTDEIRQNASSLDIDISGVDFLDLTPDSGFFVDNLSYDIFSPDEVEDESITSRISEQVENVAPDRIFVDPITQLRYLSPDEYQFRKEVLSFMQFLKEQGSTVLFTSQDTPSAPDNDLQFMSDGIVHLQRAKQGRVVSVPKFRGSNIKEGQHSLRIESGGITVFPKLVPEMYDKEFVNESISSGVPKLDKLLNGGLERGTVTIISGSPGVGKTTTGIQFMKEAAGRGERSIVYSFEEAKNTLVHRCESINIPVKQMARRGSLAIEEVEALQLSATEFANRVRKEVETNDTRIVMIDGVEGYRLALRDQDEDITNELHSLCRYLKNMGVTVILMNEMQTIVGEFQLTQEGLSYLSDNIMFIQHIEMESEIRKVIGVLKKRTSDFERHVREFQITEYGLQIGEPLLGLTGILSGNPTWIEAEDRTGTPPWEDQTKNGRSPPFETRQKSGQRRRPDDWNDEQ